MDDSGSEADQKAEQAFSRQAVFSGVAALRDLGESLTLEDEWSQEFRVLQDGYLKGDLHKQLVNAVTGHLRALSEEPLDALKKMAVETFSVNGVESLELYPETSHNLELVSTWSIPGHVSEAALAVARGCNDQALIDQVGWMDLSMRTASATAKVVAVINLASRDAKQIDKEKVALIRYDTIRYPALPYTIRYDTI